MIRILLLTMGFLSPLGGLFAQNTLPLLNNSTTWSCYGDYFFVNVKYRLGSDTLINGKSWKKVYAHGSTVPFNYDTNQAVYKSALREENGIVTVIEKGFSTEHILYNFNKGTGDTINFYKPIGDFEQGVLPFYAIGKIYKTDFVLINGIQRKRWFIHDPFMVNQLPPQALSGLDSQADIWIEGIGGKTGLFSRMPQWGVVGPQPYLLTCVENNNNLIYSNNLGYNANMNDPCFINPPGSSGGNDSLILSNLDSKTIAEEILIYPNPATTNLNIKKSMKGPFDFFLFDSNGFKIIEGSSDDSMETTSMDVSKLKMGIYCLVLQFNSVVRCYRIQKH
jgi:hypothetical protein